MSKSNSEHLSIQILVPVTSYRKNREIKDKLLKDIKTNKRKKNKEKREKPIDDKIVDTKAMGFASEKAYRFISNSENAEDELKTICTRKIYENVELHLNHFSIALSKEKAFDSEKADIGIGNCSNRVLNTGSLVSAEFLMLTLKPIVSLPHSGEPTSNIVGFDSIELERIITDATGSKKYFIISGIMKKFCEFYSVNINDIFPLIPRRPKEHNQVLNTTSTATATTTASLDKKKKKISKDSDLSSESDVSEETLGDEDTPSEEAEERRNKRHRRSRCLPITVLPLLMMRFPLKFLMSNSITLLSQYLIQSINLLYSNQSLIWKHFQFIQAHILRHNLFVYLNLIEVNNWKFDKRTCSLYTLGHEGISNSNTDSYDTNSDDIRCREIIRRKDNKIIEKKRIKEVTNSKFYCKECKIQYDSLKTFKIHYIKYHQPPTLSKHQRKPVHVKKKHIAIKYSDESDPVKIRSISSSSSSSDSFSSDDESDEGKSYHNSSEEYEYDDDDGYDEESGVDSTRHKHKRGTKRKYESSSDDVNSSDGDNGYYENRSKNKRSSKKHKKVKNHH